MSDYQQRGDLLLASDMARLAPAEVKGYFAFDHAVKQDAGAIAPRVRELIAVAVALTTQCAYCIDVHVQAAKRLGITREELAEVAAVAAAVKAGGTMGHGLLALRLYDGVAEPSIA